MIDVKHGTKVSHEHEADGSCRASLVTRGVKSG